MLEPIYWEWSFVTREKLNPPVKAQQPGLFSHWGKQSLREPPARTGYKKQPPKVGGESIGRGIEQLESDTTTYKIWLKYIVDFGQVNLPNS